MVAPMLVPAIAVDLLPATMTVLTNFCNVQDLASRAVFFNLFQVAEPLKNFESFGGT